MCLGGLFSGVLSGQIETTVLGGSETYSSKGLGYFFTNRQLAIKEDGSYTFQKRRTQQTKSIYFCRYDFERDTIYLKYKATKTIPKNQYPTEPLTDNFFYKIYSDLRLKEDVRNFVIVIPGMKNSLQDQLNSYMFRLQRAFADSSATAAFITFAWGDQVAVPFFNEAIRSADRAANDFSIFQNMLESFLADSVFFQNNPDDISFKLVCMSTGNELFNSYLINRKKQKIDLQPVYKRIVFIRSSVSADSFEDGGGFDDVTQMADSVLILVNSIDGPGAMSKSMNPKGQLGNTGPTNLQDLPESIVVKDMTSLISRKELSEMGDDYFIRNRDLRQMILYGQLIEDQRP
jgi:hypothetical protein